MNSNFNEAFFFPILMLFEVIYHKRKPFKASETFNRCIWAAI